eukprot:12745983-Alexandrium_andersonii.AAC.1
MRWHVLTLVGATPRSTGHQINNESINGIKITRSECTRAADMDEPDVAMLTPAEIKKLRQQGTDRLKLATRILQEHELHIILRQIVHACAPLRQ